MIEREMEQSATTKRDNKNILIYKQIYMCVCVCFFYIYIYFFFCEVYPLIFLGFYFFVVQLAAGSRGGESRVVFYEYMSIVYRILVYILYLFKLYYYFLL